MDGGIPTLTLMFFMAESSIPVGAKQHYHGGEAMFSWDQSYVPVGSKLCSQCCNAIVTMFANANAK